MREVGGVRGEGRGGEGGPGLRGWEAAATDTHRRQGNQLP